MEYILLGLSILAVGLVGGAFYTAAKMDRDNLTFGLFIGGGLLGLIVVILAVLVGSGKL